MKIQDRVLTVSHEALQGLVSACFPDSSLLTQLRHADFLKPPSVPSLCLLSLELSFPDTRSVTACGPPVSAALVPSRPPPSSITPECCVSSGHVPHPWMLLLCPLLSVSPRAGGQECCLVLCCSPREGA